MKRIIVGIFFIGLCFCSTAYAGELEQLQELLILHKDVRQGALAQYRLEDNTVKILEAKIRLFKAKEEKANEEKKVEGENATGLESEK